MNYSKKEIFYIRVGMILFWIIAIALFLLLPRVLGWFGKGRTISVLTWSNVIASEKVKKFEKQTGITVYLNYFESNEELLAKLHVAKEKYDLIIPSDYMVEQLIEQGHLKKLSQKFVASLKPFIKPELLGRYFDPKNEYSIPCLWDLYGLGINRKLFGSELPKPSWDLVFDEHVTPGHVVMTNDPREVVFLAALYLFGSIHHLDQQKLDVIERLLICQKKWVEAYTDLRSDYLLASGTSPIAVFPISYVMRALRFYEHLEFIMPKKTFVLIDSFVIPATSDQEQLVYEFISFLFQPDIITHHFKNFGFLPPRKDILETISFPHVDIKKLNWKNLEFFKNVVPAHELMCIWRALKAA